MKIPLFDDEVDGLRLNLVNSIHTIFDRGIEQAIKRNEESQKAIEEKKTAVSYSAEAETKGTGGIGEGRRFFASLRMTSLR